MAYNAEAQRRYRQSTKGLAAIRAHDRKRADARLEYKKAYTARWREAHPDYQCERYQIDDNARISDNLSSSLRVTLTRLKSRKRLPGRWRADSRIGHLVGCTPPQFLAHIEAQFLPGMSWANRDEWHVGHVKLCCTFDLTDSAQLAECFHFTNLRPFWAEENRRRPRA